MVDIGYKCARHVFPGRSLILVCPAYSRTQVKTHPTTSGVRESRRWENISKTYVLKEQVVKRLLAIPDSHTISGVYNPDDGIRLLEIVTPIWSKSSLATNVPYSHGK